MSSIVNNYAYLGVVRGAAFQALVAEDRNAGRFRLTTIAPGATAPPETGEIPLGAHEQHAILVRGIARDGWIHAASIVDEAGPILTMVVAAVFGGAGLARTPEFPDG